MVSKAVRLLPLFGAAVTTAGATAAAKVAVAADAVALTAPPQTALPQQHHWPASSVNCGGHFAESCRVCEQGYGPVWCNGDCTWVFEACERDSAWVKFKQVVEVAMGYWSAALGLCILQVLVMFCYALVYKKKVVNQYPKDILANYEEDAEGDTLGEGKSDGDDGRELQLFAVLGQPHTLLWACCCTPVLAAKNYHVAEVLGYWPSCFAFYITAPCPCVTALLRTFLSSKLQRVLKHKPNMLMEFLSSLCCLPCAVGRESMEVDAEECMEVKCAFQVESTAVVDIVEPTPLLENIEETVEKLERGCWAGTKDRWGNMKARACGPNVDGDDAVEPANSTGFWRSWTKKDEGEEGQEEDQEGKNRSCGWATFKKNDEEEQQAEEGAETKTMWNSITQAMPAMPKLRSTNGEKDDAEETKE